MNQYEQILNQNKPNQHQSKLCALQEEIKRCRICEELFGFEPRPIVHGQATSLIMQISQAPSIHVHQSGIPFHDLSGKRLREWYGISAEVFYNQSNFYLVSMAHCYPGKVPRGGDRLPPAICARTWLTRLLPLINNQIYLIVGSKAASYFFPKQNFSDLVFENQTLFGKHAYVIPHPSPRNVKWFMDHPAFVQRIDEIRSIIHQIVDVK